MNSAKPRRHTHKHVNIPNPKIEVPMMGIIKWALAWADQPYQLIHVRLGAGTKGSISQQSHWDKKRPEYQSRHTHLWSTPPSIFCSKLNIEASN